jgi:hypothetical protein
VLKILHHGLEKTQPRGLSFILRPGDFNLRGMRSQATPPFLAVDRSRPPPHAADGKREMSGESPEELDRGLLESIGFPRRG